MANDVPARSWLVTGVSLAGLFMAGNFIAAHVIGIDPPFCGARTDCAVVHATRYARFLGLPTAVWGAGLYAVIGSLALRGLCGRHWMPALLLSVVGLCISGYLVYVAVFVVGANCGYCLVALAVAGILFAAVLARRPAAQVTGATVAALIVVTALVSIGFATAVFGLAQPK